MEDTSRHFYNEEELKQFEDIECEWPLFLTYELINALFDENHKDAKQFYGQIQDIMVDSKGDRLIPELYQVPIDLVELEKALPHSQNRVPNENLPLVWAQSLYFLGSLLKAGLIRPDDLDPVGLHRMQKPKDTVVQILLLAENKELKNKLKHHGVKSQTLDDLPANTLVCMPEQIAELYHQIGHNDKLKLTGRPIRRLKSLTTSRLFSIHGNTYLCLSLFFLEKEFYLTFDSRFLVERFKNELTYIHRHWPYHQKPVVAIMLTENLANRGLDDFQALHGQLKKGKLGSIPVFLSSFQNLYRGARIENLDELGDQKIPHLHSETLIGQTSWLAFSEEAKPLKMKLNFKLRQKVMAPY
ncbi:MAG: hypothetical protein IPL46_25230 [Saprospiraceae bacterium]|nr:hypothetical protein [Saprospiraceae bacterium]